MPVSQPAVLVARFLRGNNYSNTLAAFLEEANLPPDAGTLSKGDLTIEQVLREKETFDLTANFERLGVEDADKGWRSPAPSTATELTILPTASNILNTSVELLAVSDDTLEPFVLSTTADRRLHMVSVCEDSFKLERSISKAQDSPILSYSVLGQSHLLMTSMSGKTVLYDCRSDAVVSERRDHSKYAVTVTSHAQSGGTWVATAGWDAKVFLYFIEGTTDGPPHLRAPVATLTLPSNPEALLFIEHPETTEPLLVLTRKDSTFLYYYALPDSAADVANGPCKLQLLGTQNLAPTSNAWIAFTPSSIALCPTDSSVAAVATSAVPHMKLIILRLLVPPAAGIESGLEDTGSAPAAPATNTSQNPFVSLTQATQARAALATQERELAAILVQCNTLAPQTAYSTPALSWRPDGSGVWVNGDDGIVRGVEASTGKVVASLSGHEAASKVRCVWAGKVGRADQSGEEWVLSGGFDQRLIVWRIPSAGAGSS
ncbi:wd40 repeat-like protein [Diplodia corticola]|uniref:Wd40 repeat-like protein n=1 Tax=Diplodia corticola TaxID=236234 RepID=A0A1J9RSA4_9PEZI|nr:wd40 repeat-like protein [Diplodia corticola]OJD35435.1 wd40 repeat-like protein [Diplodia corticola]